MEQDFEVAKPGTKFADFATTKRVNTISRKTLEKACIILRTAMIANSVGSKRARSATLFPRKTKSKPSEAGSISRGGATKRYVVFAEGGNGMSAVCEDDGPLAQLARAYD